MAIVWPCTLSVDAYAAAGEEVEVPRAECPSCLEPMVFWSGYSRFVRHEGRAHQDLGAPGSCAGRASATHALLPAFVALQPPRLDRDHRCRCSSRSRRAGGVRPAAERLGVPHTTARGWVRSFGRRARRLAVAFAALAVELGGRGTDDRWRTRCATRSAAMTAAWRAAAAPAGMAGACSPWRFCSSVCGGTLVATNTNSPYLVVGRRRFMPPVP